MASIVITLPTGLVFVVAVPNGGQSVPITIRECLCGCEEWFPVMPADHAKVYFSQEHQQAAANAKRRKTNRKKQQA